MKYRFLLLFLVIFSCSLEGTDPEEFVCTEEFVYGLQVTVRDITTNDPITNNITVIAKDGTYEEQLENMEGTIFYVGAGERPGIYIIEVTSPDYEDYTSETITVFSDPCHVVTQRVEIMLQPN